MCASPKFLSRPKACMKGNHVLGDVVHYSGHNNKALLEVVATLCINTISQSIDIAARHQFSKTTLGNPWFCETLRSVSLVCIKYRKNRTFVSYTMTGIIPKRKYIVPISSKAYFQHSKFVWVTSLHRQRSHFLLVVVPTEALLNGSIRVVLGPRSTGTAAPPVWGSATTHYNGDTNQAGPLLAKTTLPMKRL